MATRRQKIQVGIFLTTAFLLLVAALVSLAGFSRKEFDPYYMEFEESVAGLSEGSKVTYRGIAVGKITDLRVTADNRVGVAVGINPSKIVLRKGIRAKLNLESVFGPVVIDLFGGKDTAAPLLHPGATIPVERSLMANIERGIPEILQDIPETLRDLRGVMKQVNETLSKVKPDAIARDVEKLEKVLDSADKAINELRQQSTQIAKSLQSAIDQGSAGLAKTTTRINESLVRLERAADETTKLIDSIRKVVEQNRETLSASLTHLEGVLGKADKQLGAVDLAATEKSVREAADKVGKAADGIGEGAKNIARGREDVRRSLENVERSLTRSLDELDQTLRSARELFDYLERDPAALLRGKSEKGK